jgi:hypothetical protein
MVKDIIPAHAGQKIVGMIVSGLLVAVLAGALFTPVLAMNTDTFDTCPDLHEPLQPGQCCMGPEHRLVCLTKDHKLVCPSPYPCPYPFPYPHPY